MPCMSSHTRHLPCVAGCWVVQNGTGTTVNATWVLRSIMAYGCGMSARLLAQSCGPCRAPSCLVGAWCSGGTQPARGHGTRPRSPGAEHAACPSACKVRRLGPGAAQRTWRSSIRGTTRDSSVTCSDSRRSSSAMETCHLVASSRSRTGAEGITVAAGVVAGV